MQLERIRLVYVKELVEALRDHRTLVPMVFMSIILGPLLLLAVPRLAVSEAKHIATDTYKIAVVGESPLVATEFARWHEFQRTDIGTQAPQDAVDKGIVDAALVVAPNFNILYNGVKVKSSIARFRLSMFVDIYKRAELDRRIKGLSLGLVEPPRVQIKEVSPDSPFGVASVFLQSALCCVLMMMALMGVIYPALDAVTGERERQTLEPLLMTMAARKELFAGKLLTVATTSYVSVLLTLAGFFASQFFQRAAMHNLKIGFEADFPWPCFLITCLAMLPLCLTVAAASLMFASFAKTIQQGQGYFLPLMMLGLVPLPIALFGDVHLTAATAMLPFLNSVVTFNDVLAGYIDYRWLALSFCSSIAFCYLIVNLASPMLAREDLLFDIEEAPARRFAAQDYRRELFFLCVVVFLLMFYLSQVLVLNYRLFGMALTQLLVVLLPGIIFVHYWLRLPLASVINLSWPKGGLATLLATALIAPATVAVAAGFVYLQSQFMPGAETLSKLMAKALELTSAPPLVLLLVIGVLPGLCEEVLFRGVILSLLPRRFSQTKLILTVGALFGAFHLSLARFIPTGALGALLTFLRLRTGSLWPAMLLHCLHNSLSLALSLFVPGNPPLWMAAAAVLSGVIGMFWLIALTRPEKAT
ncbi:MAG: CPBP family intramembrane metalloprotease [Cyanobacteria bacterium REEB67]|nr:CPBP family intramembrane metalloprotease [Cyanobacteria bacterium REEB67]